MRRSAILSCGCFKSFTVRLVLPSWNDGVEGWAIRPSGLIHSWDAPSLTLGFLPSCLEYQGNEHSWDAPSLTLGFLPSCLEYKGTEHSWYAPSLTLGFLPSCP